MKAELSESAIRVLHARYLKKDQDGTVIETPDDMFKRVALHVSRGEISFACPKEISRAAEDFYEMMSSLEFLPNSPALMNAGRDLGQMAACFVLPVNDSLRSIFDAVKNTAIIHQSGGGTGFSFSKLRPKNDIVLSTSGVASGPVSFMDVFNKATDIVKQGGTRRGANMGVLRVDHPDIEEFITVKRDHDRLSCFNLSVGVTDAFMDAVKNDLEFSLINPHGRNAVRTVEARKIFDLMAQCAWEDGEPGILFLDEINRYNPLPALGDIDATNPCGEQPLLPYEACNLGSINLTKMLKTDNGHASIDWEKLHRTIHLATRFLDDVIEINRYPLPRIKRLAKANRKIGLGVMGFAHMLIMLGIPYDSDEGVETAGRLMQFIKEQSHDASRALARERGAFPNFPGSIFDRSDAAPMRNATLTTIAPTGSLSLIAGCSSGIEPLYALYYSRIIPGDIGVTEIDPVFLSMAQNDESIKTRLMNEIKRSGSLSKDSVIQDRLRLLFATATQIPPARHVMMQAAFQSHTDNAVSKTINFSSHVLPEDIKEVFLLAYDMKCKGITVYRDGSRTGQTLTCGLTGTC